MCKIRLSWSVLFHKIIFLLIYISTLVKVSNGCMTLLVVYFLPQLFICLKQLFVYMVRDNKTRDP